MNFLIYLINGLSLGSIYSLIALGYTMVYGIVKMLNFAHADILMVSCYITMSFINIGLNPLLSVLFSSIIASLIGFFVEKIAYKPLRETNSLSVLITAIGVSYFIENVVLIIYGANPKGFKSIFSLQPVHLFNNSISISAENIISIFLCILIMIILTIFVNKTKLGQAMLAVSEDKKASILMGISVDKTISLTFIIGSFLASIAGVLFCSIYPILSPSTGSMPGIKAFIAAVIGGIGSIPGAFLGGIILGLLETFSKAYISAQLSDAIVFAILIIVLLVKPSGILKKSNIEKV